jgi:cytochrome b561
MGLTVLSLVILRILWALTSIKPGLPEIMKPWERYSERYLHFTLYLLLLIMPLSGWLMSTAAGYAPSFFGLFSIPMPRISHNENLAGFAGEIHYKVAWLLILLVSIHILAAFKHHFIDKDNILKRMWPG